MYIDNEFWQDEIYLSVANKYSIFNNWDVNLSVDYQWNTLDATLTNFACPTRHTLLAALATSFQWRGIKAMASVLNTFVSDHSVVSSGTGSVTPIRKNRNVVTPAVFLSYQPNEDLPLNIRAFYKRIFRMPTFNDLYYTDIGNAQLNPEYVDQYDVGVQYTASFKGFVSRVMVKADFYYNHVTDKIIAVPKGTGQYRWMMMNIGIVKIKGIDVNAHADFRLFKDANLSLNLNYTYQKAQDYTDPTDNDPDGGTYKGQIAYVPWHSGSVVANATWKGVGLNYSFIYVGERYHTSSNIRANYEQPWYTHDISGSYCFKVKNMQFTATLEVNNLFNQYYDVIQNYPMPGRNYKFIIKFEI